MGVGRRDALFDERQFSWPEQPAGNPRRDAKLPWFWFLDVGEAKSYLMLWTVVQFLGFGLFLNFWFFKSVTLGVLLFVPAVVAQTFFLRIWVGLCRRAHPRLKWWQWINSGWANPRARHCLVLAREVVQEAEGSKQPGAMSR